jgi:hypothetical protein
MGDRSPHRVRDAIAILLLLAVGTGGLIFVFSMPDPFASLAPHIPLLSPLDWPGSDASITLGISSEWQWREKREFQTQLNLRSGSYGGGIGQTAIWYADPLEAAADWTRLDRLSYEEEPFVRSGGGDGQPVYILFCGSAGTSLVEGYRECWYLAYWKHWYTAVNYRSQLGEDLHASEMQKFAARVDQLLMSAPDEPCYGILCTETKSGLKP